MIFERLVQFRQNLYDQLGRSQDALFDLLDAVLTTPDLSSLVRVSQNPLFRRQWSSLYSGLKRARLPRGKLMQQQVQRVDCDEPPRLAGDTTGWTRPEAQTLKERTFEHQGGRIALGQGYNILAWIPETEGSWALPLCHERLTRFETAVSKAVFQLKKVCRQLPVCPLVG